MPRIWNFTPHKVNIQLTGAPEVEFPSDGSVRLSGASEEERPFGQDDPRTLRRPGDNLAIPTFWPQEVSGMDTASSDLLKQIKVGDSIIVSMIVAQWLQKRGKKHGWDDGDEGDIFKTGVRVYVPATSPKHAVRNKEGQIIAVKGLEFYCNLAVPV